MKTLATIFGLAFGASLMAQTAANWTVNDCSGNSHSLFTDLDAGKVAVIIWVMPCANCINGALSAQTEVQNALVSNPGKVVYYLADDNGNTNCTTLTNWASTNGVTSAIVISSNQVSMSPYGAAGMPKIVVVGGGAHTVFYNQNAPNITSTGIQNAITSALAAPTGLTEKQKNDFSFGVYPNPSNVASKISVNMIKEGKVTLEIHNELGQKVSEVYKGNLATGSHDFALNTLEFANGSYFVNFSDGEKTIQERLIINH